MVRSSPRSPRLASGFVAGAPKVTFTPEAWERIETEYGHPLSRAQRETLQTLSTEYVFRVHLAKSRQPVARVQDLIAVAANRAADLENALHALDGPADGAGIQALVRIEKPYPSPEGDGLGAGLSIGDLLIAVRRLRLQAKKALAEMVEPQTDNEGQSLLTADKHSPWDWFARRLLQWAEENNLPDANWPSRAGGDEDFPPFTRFVHVLQAEFPEDIQRLSSMDTLDALSQAIRRAKNRLDESERTTESKKDIRDA